MKTKLLLIISLFCTLNIAQAQNISCEFKESMDVLWRTTYQIPNLGKVKLTGHQLFEFSIEHLGGSLYELAVLDKRVPARYYVQSNLATQSDLLSWSLWNREDYINLDCRKY